jgi:hypothetical protein
LGSAVFGREREVARLGSARRVVPLDPDRSLVRAAQADPSHFDALYRKYLAQVYSLPTTSSAITTRRRT